MNYKTQFFMLIYFVRRVDLPFIVSGIIWEVDFRYSLLYLDRPFEDDGRQLLN